MKALKITLEVIVYTALAVLVLPLSIFVIAHLIGENVASFRYFVTSLPLVGIGFIAGYAVSKLRTAETEEKAIP